MKTHIKVGMFEQNAMTSARQQLQEYAASFTTAVTVANLRNRLQQSKRTQKMMEDMCEKQVEVDKLHHQQAERLAAVIEMLKEWHLHEPTPEEAEDRDRATRLLAAERETLEISQALLEQLLSGIREELAGTQETQARMINHFASQHQGTQIGGNWGTMSPTFNWGGKTDEVKKD